MFRTGTRSGVICLLLFFLARSESPAMPGDQGALMVICANWADNTCSIIDVAAGEEVATVAVGSKPYDVKAAQFTARAYVTNSGQADVSVIDLASFTELGRIPVGDNPREIELTSDGLRAVVANAGSDSVSVIDLLQQIELYSVPVGSIPYGVALTADQQRAFVSNWGEGTVSVVQLGPNSGEVIGTIPVGALPYSVMIPPGGQAAYVTVFAEHKVVPIDLTTLQPGRPIAVDQSPWGMAVSDDGQGALVCGFYEGVVSVLALSGDPPSYGKVERRIDIDIHAQRRAAAKNAVMLPDSSLAFVGDLANDTLVVIDIAQGPTGQQIEVGNAPYGLDRFFQAAVR